MRKSKERLAIQLGTNIARLRRKAGFESQESFAKFTGLAPGTIKDIERGISEGYVETREVIAKALGCTIADLYIDESSRPKTALTFELATLVLSELQKASPERRALVLGLLFGDETFFADLPDDVFQSVRALSIVR